MKVISEKEIDELVAKGRMSAKDRLKSGIMSMSLPEITPEDRMAASLEKLAVLTATIATELNKPKDEVSIVVPENDKLVDTLDKMSGLIEMLIRRIEKPPARDKKSYDFNVKRDNNGFIESLNVKEK